MSTTRAAAAGRGGLRAPDAVRVLVVTCLALGVATLNATAVNVALPDVARDLGVRLTGLQWVANAYTVVYAAVLLPAGALGDRWGRRRLLLVGASVFAVGSVFCALAPSFPVLVAARVVQGLGGAATVPATLAVLASEFTDPSTRARALGLWAGVASLGLAAGPLVGGGLIAGAGWRGIFWLVAALGAVSLLLVHRLVSPERHARPGEAPPPDVPGALLGVVALGGLSFGLIESERYGWASPAVVVALAAAAAALVAFVAVEGAIGRAGGRPLMPLELWRSPTFVVANLGGAGYFFSLFGILFFISLYLQQVQGDSALRTGLYFLPLTAVMALLAPYAGRVVAGLGVRPVVVGGLLTAAAGCLSLATLPANGGSGALVWRLLLTGVGFGLTSAPLTTAAVAAVPAGAGGLASAVFNASRQVGAVLGVAVLGVVVTEGEHAAAGPGSPFLVGLHAAFAVSAGVLAALAVAGLVLLRPRMG